MGKKLLSAYVREVVATACFRLFVAFIKEELLSSSRLAFRVKRVVWRCGDKYVP